MQDGTATLEACGSPNEKGTRSFEDPHRAATVSEARRLIAMHAWRWLQEGRLVSLADLMRALALVPCSLAATMQVHCASCWKNFFFFSSDTIAVSGCFFLCIASGNVYTWFC